MRTTESTAAGIMNRQDLVQHFPVLPGDADNRPEFTASLQFLYNRTHLDCLRTGAENQHDLFHMQ